MSKLVYVDTSAVLRIVFESPESSALKELLDRLRDHANLYTSHLGVCEAQRFAIREKAPDVLVNRAVSGFDTLVLDPETYRRAGQNPDQDLGLAEALHLAAAQRFGCDTIITYSRALAEAAEAGGIAVLAPGP